MCYFEQPKGHTMVIQGMDSIKDSQSDYGRFDAWLKTLLAVLNGRGKMGSIVGASTDVRQIASKSNPDIPVTEHAVKLFCITNKLTSH
jgi:hypothetical protein